MSLRVLVVDTQAFQLGMTSRALTELGCEVTVVSGFEDAKRRVASGQSLDLLIADVRLGAYNGLHLALRAKTLHSRIHIIITDAVFDAATQREAQKVGAYYVIKPLSAARLAELIATIFSSDTHGISGSRRYQRVSIPDEVLAEVGEFSGRLVDVSYGGVRMAFPSEEISNRLPDVMTLVIPSRRLTVSIQPVWTQHPAEKEWQCGGRVVTNDVSLLDEWRRFVDTYVAFA